MRARGGGCQEALGFRVSGLGFRVSGALSSQSASPEAAWTRIGKAKTSTCDVSARTTRTDKSYPSTLPNLFNSHLTAEDK